MQSTQFDNLLGDFGKRIERIQRGLDEVAEQHQSELAGVKQQLHNGFQQKTDQLLFERRSEKWSEDFEKLSNELDQAKKT